MDENRIVISGPQRMQGELLVQGSKNAALPILAAGVMGHIMIQVILNVAVVTNTIPNTGITLPFVSYGGTSVVFLLLEMGIALSVSRGVRKEH